MNPTPDNDNIYKKPPAGIGPDGKAYRAIIVDDSRMARQILKQILLSVKFDVIDEIDNGGAAIEKLKNPTCDSIICCRRRDAVMNGIEVVKSIRSSLPNCKIVMVTSHGEREKIEELIKLGINGYIKNPSTATRHL